jgi:exonuclease III
LSKQTSKQEIGKTKQGNKNNRHLSILTLNVNGLNAPIKRHRIANWIEKQDPTIYCLQETCLTEKNKHWLRVKGWKKVFQAKGLYKQAGAAVLISDKVDFKLKSIGRDNEGHFILMKGTIHQEEISILNIYAPNTRAPIYIKKQKRTNGPKSTDRH